MPGSYSTKKRQRIKLLIRKCSFPTDYRFQDLTGLRFSRWSVMKLAGRDEGKNFFWECRCDCGKIVVVSGKNLRSGISRSCGCYSVDLLRSRSLRHGEGKRSNRSAEYRTWKAMNVRCHNKDQAAYKRYGGRGIRICRRWLGPNGFQNFLEDMGRKPTPEHTLDRIDNDGNYCSENCRWATRKQQARNTRTNRFLTYQGEKKTLSEWGERFHLAPDLISCRIKRGWSMEQALNIPSGQRR